LLVYLGCIRRRRHAAEKAAASRGSDAEMADAAAHRNPENHGLDPADGWIYDGESGMFYSHTVQLWFDPVSGEFGSEHGWTQNGQWQ
jgi:hypothetical protein